MYELDIINAFSFYSVALFRFFFGRGGVIVFARKNRCTLTRVS